MFVSSRNFRIRYQAFGAGQPLVLLHGLTMWGDRWIDRGYVHELKDRYRLIVPDLLGHGESDRPHDPAAYGSDNIAADVLAILNAEQAGPAHLWGYSWGTMIAEKLAASHPDRVASMVLGGYPVGLSAAQHNAMEPTPQDLPGSIEEWFEDWPPPLAEVFIAHNDFGAMLAVLETFFKCPTTIPEIRAAGRPALAYYGTDDLHFDLAREQANVLPCRFEAVPGDHPMAFAQAGNILPAAIAHFESAGG